MLSGALLIGDSHWDRIVSTADPGRAPPHCDGTAPLSNSSQENGDQAYRRQVAHGRCRRGSPTSRGQWRRQLGGTHRAIRYRGASGGYGFALAVIVDWLRPGGVKPVPRVVMGPLLGFAGLALLVGPAHLGGSERVDPRGAAVLVVASLAWACGSLYSKHGGMPSSPMLGVAMQSFAGGTILLIAPLFTGEFRVLHLGAISLRSWLALAYLVVFGSGIGFSVYLHSSEEHRGARGNVRVREPSCGAVPGLAHRRGDHLSAHCGGCRGHSHRRHSGDHRPAPDSGARKSGGSNLRRSMIVRHFLRPCCNDFAEPFRIDLLLSLRYF
jgi:hypothetical protein